MISYVVVVKRSALIWAPSEFKPCYRLGLKNFGKMCICIPFFPLIVNYGHRERAFRATERKHKFSSRFDRGRIKHTEVCQLLRQMVPPVGIGMKCPKIVAYKVWKFRYQLYFNITIHHYGKF